MLPTTVHNEEFNEEHDAAPKESEFILRINMVNTVWVTNANKLAIVISFSFFISVVFCDYVIKCFFGESMIAHLNTPKSATSTPTITVKIGNNWRNSHYLFWKTAADTPDRISQQSDRCLE